MRKIYDICINILRIKNSNSCINTKDCEFQCSKFNFGVNYPMSLGHDN